MSKPVRKTDKPQAKPAEGQFVRKNATSRRNVVSSPTAKTGTFPVAPRDPRPHAGYETERAAYAQLKPGLLETAFGRFVVLVGDELAGPFDDFRAAYVAGRRRFGPGPLYIKQVLAEEPVFEPVGLEPCPS